MNWPPVIDFIRARAPAYLSAIEGVPDEALTGLVGQRGARWPGSYATFVRLMGANSGNYAPFGVTQEHRLAAIAERLSEADEPPDARFFPVALETDDSLEVLHDHVLDLQRCDGNDAALVLLEQDVSLEGQKPVELFESLGERIIASAFNHFECRLRTERDVVAVGGANQAGQGRRALHEAVALLEGLGFTPALPPMPRLVCLVRGRLDVLARAAVLELAGQLLTGLTGARRPASAGEVRGGLR